MSALGMLGSEIEGPLRCSRAGCREHAVWSILWRNPKIHSEDRQKTWLACEAHRSVLEEFLSARNFPLQVVPVAAMDTLSRRTDPKEHNA